jgi:hypothetical protein
LYAFIFLIIGIAGFIGNGTQFMALEICGQKYSKRLRGHIFDAYLRQAATAYEFYLQRGFEDGTKTANAQSGQVAGEAFVK